MMLDATLDATFREVLSSPLAGAEILVVWSLGEPLAAPISFYEKALALAEQNKRAETKVRHHFQTNGTLLTDEWCRFIRDKRIGIALSIDGPRELHNESRRTRAGGGTFDLTMRGAKLLQAHQIDFGVISVVGAATLAQPDLLFDFYEENHFQRVGLNVEEIDGINLSSSLEQVGVEERFRLFIRQMFVRFRRSEVVTYLREYRPETVARLLEAEAASSGELSAARPGIVSVDVDGNFTLLGPELLGLRDAAGEDFALGNLTRDGLVSVEQTDRFRKQLAEVEAGVAACRNTCRYFSICGGGPPSNKFFETGTFSSTETLYCRLVCKATADVTLDIIHEQNRS